MKSNWTRIDSIRTESLIDWAREQTLFPELFNGQPTKRFEAWYGLGVELLKGGKSWRIYQARPINQEPLLKELCDRYLPFANSVLLYHYPVGVGIGEHYDKPVFNNQVVIVNLIDAQTDLFGEKPPIKFKFGGVTKILHDGDVVKFDASVNHGLPPVKVPRYSLSLRVIEDSIPAVA